MSLVFMWFYNWVIYPLGLLGASVVGFFVPKVRRTLRIRKWKAYTSLRYHAGQTIDYWIHVASSGELEYAIPVIQELEKRKHRVAVTYYSISAKEIIEKLPEQYKNVSLVMPLPHDGFYEMSQFVQIMQQQGVRALLLLKYELWPSMLYECHKKQLTVYLVNALRPRGVARFAIGYVDYILSGYPKEIDPNIYKNLVITGDTRVQRVVERLKVDRDDFFIRKLSQWAQNKKLIVLGSLWPQDWEHIKKHLDLVHAQGLTFLIFPHELDQKFCEEILQDVLNKNISGFVIQSESDLEKVHNQKVLIVNKKGILVESYKSAVAAYVGGGWGVNVHSVWEPFLAGAYVYCGPRRDRSPESYELESAGYLSVLETESEYADWLQNILKKTKIDRSQIEQIILKHKEAAVNVVNILESKRNAERISISH